MTLSEKISALRKQRGLSQEDLAGMMRITRQAVSRWEQGESIPDIDNIVQLSKIFNVSTDYLLKNGEQAQEPEREPPHHPPAKEKPPMPWVYKKFFHNDFIYIVVFGIYIFLGFAFDWWAFAWPILILMWAIQWGMEAWFDIEDEDE